MKLQRLKTSEARHDQLLSQLRAHLRRVLRDKHRVAVLIDNLDKPWTPAADLDSLSSFLLGLLSSVGPIPDKAPGRHGRRKRRHAEGRILRPAQQPCGHRPEHAIDRPVVRDRRSTVAPGQG